MCCSKISHSTKVIFATGFKTFSTSKMSCESTSQFRFILHLQKVLEEKHCNPLGSNIPISDYKVSINYEGSKRN
uniref:Uncharacterized protein n=1 Tax=Pinctada fucata TaxID=50426 RepID=A0A194ANT5_PINFU